MQVIPIVRTPWKFALIMTIALVALIAAACSSNEPTAAVTIPTQSTSQPQTTATKTTQQLSGSIEIDGSSTVYPITEAVAEEFRKVHPNVRVNVGVSGTGGGFKRFTAGETAISDASRPIKDTEAAAAIENDVEFLELQVAIDGLSVMVSPSNNFVECLTVEELKAIWEPGSTIDNWNQVRSSFPNQTLRLYGPGTDSGTFDYFTEVINGEAQASRADYTGSEDDNVLVQGIGGDRNALGYFGYAYYVENTDKLKLVAIDSGSGCVTPSDATIEAGEYSPLSRPLFIYVSTEELKRPEVKAFVEFYMEHGSDLAAEVGYIRLADSIYAANLAQVKVAK
ncbi:MAG: PstS family phosphate ABC transporter substrate-binding protein [Chloroflexi bacterium]|nr:PstS family phosphate ABC transporter substrate-binding protein [Chloroflexota bacterium]